MFKKLKRIINELYIVEKNRTEGYITPDSKFFEAMTELMKIKKYYERMMWCLFILSVSFVALLFIKNT